MTELFLLLLFLAVFTGFLAFGAALCEAYARFKKAKQHVQHRRMK